MTSLERHVEDHFGPNYRKSPQEQSYRKPSLVFRKIDISSIGDLRCVIEMCNPYMVI